MLQRSFKPAKCKTALKLAVSRIKLLKNKKDAQVKQIKRELAQFMESGQYRTARIKVEQVVREEKLRAAYELIEIYCELIVARLPMVESQKNCPIDLKEAVTSVVFASPRCADVPELLDIRKHFQSKYGKEFITAAVELRPESGVSRMLIEKLSTKSPDGPTKMKILAAIAEEHNVKWDPEAFEEKPPEDLVNGPNTYGMTSNIQSDPALPPPPPTHDVRGQPPNAQIPNSMASKAHVESPPGPSPPDQPPNAQVPRRNYEYHDGPVSFKEQNARASPHIQDSGSADVSPNEATTSGKFHPEARSSGTRSDRMEMHAFPGDGHAPGSQTQNWNMQFKDAASAAQAAAESAELASRAARAAAELSRQYSSEMRNKSNQSASVPTNIASAPTNTASINNDYLVDSVHMAERYPQKKSPEHERHDIIDDVRMKRQSGYSEDLRASEMQAAIRPENIPHIGDTTSENKFSRTSTPSSSSVGSDLQKDDLTENDQINYFADMSTGKQSVSSFSPSHSGNFTNNQEIASSVRGEHSYVSDANIHQSTIGMNSEKNAPLAFDDSGSDDDNYKGQESSLFFSSPSRTSFSMPSASFDPWSFEKKADEVPIRSVSQSISSSVQHSAPVFSEGLTGSAVPSEPNDSLPVTFDNSDGPSSDSEEELDMSKVVRSNDSRFTHEKTIQSTKSGKSQSGSHRSVSSSSYDEVQPERSQGIEFSASSQRSSDFDKSVTSQQSPRPKKSGLDNEVLRQTVKEGEAPNECSCISDTDNDGLPFGVLKGGIRNKGLRHPPYSRKSDNTFSSKQVTDVTPTDRISVVSHISREEPYSRKGSMKQNKEQRAKKAITYVAPFDDSSEDELSHESLSSRRPDLYNHKSASQVVNDDSSEDELSRETLNSKRQDLYNQKSASPVKTSSPSTFFFNSEDSEVEEDLPPPRKISTRVARPSPTFSRRTQPSTNSVRTSDLKTSDEPDAPKFSSRSSDATETLPSASSQNKSSQEWRRPVEQAAPESFPESKRSSSVETSKSSNPPPMVVRSEMTETSKSSGQRPFAREQSSNPPSKVVTSERTRPSETSLSSGTKSLGREQSSHPPKVERAESSESSRSSGYKSFAREQPSDPPAKFMRPERTEPSKFSPPKSFVREQPSDPPAKSVRPERTEPSKFSPPKIIRSESSETSKSTSSLAEPPAKASHVHPKLPNSDDLFAKFAALKQNRS